MGLAVVEHLVARGWNVAVVDKNRIAGEQVEKSLGERVLFFDVDVTKYELQADAFVKTWAKWNRLDMGKGNASPPKAALLTCPSLCQCRTRFSPSHSSVRQS